MRRGSTRPTCSISARVRLADVDGSGVVDIIYLGRHGAALYYNHAGNRWSPASRCRSFPASTVSHRCTCSICSEAVRLAWSGRHRSPGDTARPVRYLDLMGGTNRICWCACATTSAPRR
jgi:hypothetical protein